MNKKGQDSLNYMGLIVGIFVTIIVALALFQASAGNLDKAVNTFYLGNTTYTAAADGVTIDLQGQELLSTPLVQNATSGAAVPSTNYTIQEGVSATTGVKVIQYTGLVGAFEGESINISYTYGDEGYIEDSGGRGIANIILVFAALAVAVVTLIPSLRSGVMDMMR